MPDHQHYNTWLVLLSYLISVLGSFTALQLAVVIPLASTSRQRMAAVLASGAAMGVGAIWAMHFIAMLACDMGMPVTYDPVLTALSAIIAFVACSLGLFIASSGAFSWAKLAAAGICMGLGVTGMHYLGMAAVMMAAYATYDMNLVASSLFIAIVASIVALWLAFHLRGRVQMIGSALVMGIAVCGMHYTGMAAFNIDDNGGQQPAGFAHGMRGDYLGMTIFVVALVLLAAALIVHYKRQQRRAAITI
ncbi:MHYT domain-containing protein [Dyella flagellata]|uniref:MHYT domain-containing protein n=1 Tax=Dyella flagellata TaxID=1867833 RepID=UPI0024E085AE|nr:MHYT domain-containing protein [Dyella flagellata]